MQACESLLELRPIRTNAHVDGIVVGNARRCPLLCLEAKQRGLSAFHQGLHTFLHLSYQMVPGGGASCIWTSTFPRTSCRASASSPSGTSRSNEITRPVIRLRDPFGRAAPGLSA